MTYQHVYGKIFKTDFDDIQDCSDFNLDEDISDFIIQLSKDGCKNFKISCLNTNTTVIDTAQYAGAKKVLVFTVSCVITYEDGE